MKLVMKCRDCGKLERFELTPEEFRMIRGSGMEVVCADCKKALMVTTKDMAEARTLLFGDPYEGFEVIYGRDPRDVEDFCKDCKTKSNCATAECTMFKDLARYAGELIEDPVVPVIDAPKHPTNLYGRTYICPTGKVPCEMCQGTGVKIWGAIVNDRPTHSGECYRCLGKGYQTDADTRRNWGYDNHRGM